MDNHPLFAYSTLAASASSAALTLTVVDGTPFPDPSGVGAYNAVVWTLNAKPVAANAEVVRVTAKAGAVLTVTRAQEGSTAHAYAAGDEFAVAITPKLFTDIETPLATAIADIAAHIADTADAHDASSISVDSTTLVGTGTDAQAVFEELDNAIADHLADTVDAHDASAISNVPAGNLAATTVQAALDELQSDVDTRGTASVGMILVLGG